MHVEIITTDGRTWVGRHLSPDEADSEKILKLRDLDELVVIYLEADNATHYIRGDHVIAASVVTDEEDR